MKILITGSSGMLGGALCRELSGKYEVVGLDVLQLQAPSLPAPLPAGQVGSKLQAFIQCDITDREKTIADISSLKPDIVIHTAAYTNVDGCEQNPDKAQRINARGTETIALACQKCSAFLCYISTDFVFDGEKKTAYIESDKPNPVNIYGKSKLEGEQFVQSILKEFIIIRSSWLFGKGGRNFVDMLLKKAQNERRIEVVNDQFGSPTYAKNLAEALVRLISLEDKPKGIYHVANSGSCSWYEFALAIKEIANLDTNIAPISSGGYHSPTKRPRMSILEDRRYQECTGAELRHWKEALKEYLLNTN